MKRPKWNEEDRFLFTTQRLRARTSINRQKEGRRRACRQRFIEDEY